MSQEQVTSQEQKRVEIVSNEGVPFKTTKAGKAAMVGKGLDPMQYTVVQKGDGYIITTVEDALKMAQDTTKPTTGPVEVKATAPSVEPVTDHGYPCKGWSRVRFHAKGHDTDPNDVILSVNGDTLVLMRNKIVIIPNSFRECADHATYEKFEVQPGQERKVSAVIQKYPYDYLGIATEAEYRTMRDAGNKTQAASLAQAAAPVA